MSISSKVKLVRINPWQGCFYQDTLIQLDHDFMDHAWSKGSWEQYFEKEVQSDQFWLLEDKESGKMLGYMLLRGPDPTALHLLKIVFQKEFQGRGLATYLVTEFLKQNKQVRSMYLEVDSANESAVKFYKKLGFDQVHKTENYYSSGAEATFFLLNFHKIDFLRNS